MGVLFPNGVSRGKETLEAYQARGGYQALERARGELTSDGVLGLVEAAGGAIHAVAGEARSSTACPVSW